MQESSLGRWPKLDSHCEKKAFIPGWEEGLTMGAGCPSQGCSIQHPCEEPAWGQYRSLNQEEGTKNSDILDGITGLRHWTSLEPTTPQASHQASWWISFQVKPVWSGFLLYAAKCFPLDVVSKRQEDSVWKTNDWGTRTHRNNNWQILNHSPGFLQTCHSKVHQCVLRAWLRVLGQGCGKGESDDPLALPRAELPVTFHTLVPPPGTLFPSSTSFHPANSYSAFRSQLHCHFLRCPLWNTHNRLWCSAYLFLNSPHFSL